MLKLIGWIAKAIYGVVRLAVMLMIVVMFLPILVLTGSAFLGLE